MPAVSVQIGIAWVSASVRRILYAQFRVRGFTHIGTRPGADSCIPFSEEVTRTRSGARERGARSCSQHSSRTEMRCLVQASSQGLVKFAAL